MNGSLGGIGDLIITLDDATSEHDSMCFVEGGRHCVELSGDGGGH